MCAVADIIEMVTPARPVITHVWLVTHSSTVLSASTLPPLCRMPENDSATAGTTVIRIIIAMNANVVIPRVMTALDQDLETA